MRIIDTAMRRSRTVVLSLAVIIIAGVMTYVSVPKEAEPDINIPMIYVSMTHDGISPEDAERLLVRPMEQEIRTIEGIEELTANAYEGGASLTIEFDAGTDVDIALQVETQTAEVRKISLARGHTQQPLEGGLQHVARHHLVARAQVEPGDRSAAAAALGDLAQARAEMGMLGVGQLHHVIEHRRQFGDGDLA